LLPLGVMHAASFGLSVVLGNWVATLLQRGGHESAHVAGLVGGLVLFLGVVSRPAGGRLLERPRVVQASFVVGGFAIGLLSIARPLPLAIAAAAVVGLAAGVPFASAFAGAQRIRPDAPAAAVGVVNLAATIVILVGTPLVGLSFSLPGDGRIGFLVCGFLFASAALAVRARN
jgi:nitrate/nitrite transporter NarK